MGHLERDQEKFEDKREQAKQKDRALREEEGKIRRLRFVVDFAGAVLCREQLTLEQALAVVKGVKGFALALFPDKGETFDLIYGSRFRRILTERFPLG